jgi:localization factor PodJL
VEPAPPHLHGSRHGEGPADSELLAMFENLDFGDDDGPTAPVRPDAVDDQMFQPRAPAPPAAAHEDLDPSDPFVAHAFVSLGAPSRGDADEKLFADEADDRAFDGLDFGNRADRNDPHDSFFTDEPAFAAPAVAASPGRDDGIFGDEPAAEEEQRPLTTRELIAQARNAARTASASGNGNSSTSEPAPERGLFKTRGLRSKGDAANPAEPARGPFGLSLPKRKRKDDTVSTVTLLLATAVSLTVTATVLGFMIVSDGTKDEGHGAPLIARTGGAVTAATPPSSDATAGAPSTQANELAVATAPNPAGTPATSGPNDEGKALYAKAVSQMQAKDDAKAFPTLVRAAAAGYPAAQFHLSKIYERGGAGQAADLVKARMWAERAAKAGVAEAMFNLGLFMYEGQGGPPDLPGAADWFTRAAKLGLKDAQYNLARLYENGYGVTQNFSLAYQWYLVAADVSGDKEAHADADRLRPTLTAEGRKTAERFAQTFHPEPAAAFASAPTTGRLAQTR